MSGVSPVSIAVPEFSVDRLQIEEVAKNWLKDDPQAREKFVRISSNCGVSNRNFVLPYDLILAQSGLKIKNERFLMLGKNLLGTAMKDCIDKSACDAKTIGYSIYTSCSMPTIPAVDAEVGLSCGLSQGVSRIPIFQHGCAGGVVALGLAGKLAKLGKPVLVSSLEVCSLVFQPDNHEGARLVGAAIFADGAASVLIGAEDSQINIIDSQTFLMSETNHLMGYEILDDGFHLRLDRTLPQMVGIELPKQVAMFLDKHGLKRKDIAHWLFHPGGIRILDYLKENLELSEEQMLWSRKVLDEHGNLSSATILFVLKESMDSSVFKPNENVLVLGIGPGLTIELVLLRS